jgi:hypothetical protein
MNLGMLWLGAVIEMMERGTMILAVLGLGGILLCILPGLGGDRLLARIAGPIAGRGQGRAAPAAGPRRRLAEETMAMPASTTRPPAISCRPTVSRSTRTPSNTVQTGVR